MCGHSFVTHGLLYKNLTFLSTHFFDFFVFFLTIIENTLYRALPASYNVKKRAHDTLFFYRYAVTTASILFFTISAISVVFIPWYSSYGIGSRK